MVIPAVARVFPRRTVEDYNSNGTMNRRIYILESLGDNVTRWVVQGRHYCYAVFGHETRHGYRLDLISTTTEKVR